MLHVLFSEPWADPGQPRKIGRRSVVRISGMHPRNLCGTHCRVGGHPRIGSHLGPRDRGCGKTGEMTTEIPQTYRWKRKPPSLGPKECTAGWAPLYILGGARGRRAISGSAPLPAAAELTETTRRVG